MQPLEGDGVLSRVWPFLWEGYRVEAEEAGHGLEPLPFFVPQTVLFNFRSPSAWFFSTMDGRLRRKSKRNCTIGKLREGFVGRGPAGLKRGERGVAPVMACVLEEREDLDAGGSVRYLGEAELDAWIRDTRKMRSGELQQFVAATGGYTETLRVNWSPRIFMVHKARADVTYEAHRAHIDADEHGRHLAATIAKAVAAGATRTEAYEIVAREERGEGDTKSQKRRKLLKEKKGEGERMGWGELSERVLHRMAATFDGDADTGTHDKVRSRTLLAHLHEASEAIVRLLYRGTNGLVKVTRMVVDFRVGRDNRLWLLGVRSLRHEPMFDATDAIPSSEREGDVMPTVSKVIRKKGHVYDFPVSEFGDGPVDAGPRIPFDVPLREGLVSAGDRGALWRRRRSTERPGSAPAMGQGRRHGLLQAAVGAVDDIVSRTVGHGTDWVDRNAASTTIHTMSLLHASRQRQLGISEEEEKGEDEVGRGRGSPTRDPSLEEVCCPSCGTRTRAALMRVVEAGAVIDQYDAVLDMLHRVPVCPPALVKLRQVLGLDRPTKPKSSPPSSSSSSPPLASSSTIPKGTFRRPEIRKRDVELEEEAAIALRFLPKRLRPKTAEMKRREEKGKRPKSSRLRSRRRLFGGRNGEEEEEEEERGERRGIEDDPGFARRAFAHYPLERPDLERKKKPMASREPSLTLSTATSGGFHPPGLGTLATSWKGMESEASKISRNTGMYFALHGAALVSVAPPIGSSAFYADRWVSDRGETVSSVDTNAIRLVTDQLREARKTVAWHVVSDCAMRAQQAADLVIQRATPTSREKKPHEQDDGSHRLGKPSHPIIQTPIGHPFLNASLILAAFGHYSAPFKWALEVLSEQKGKMEVESGRAMADHAKGVAILTEEAKLPLLREGLTSPMSSRDIAATLPALASRPRFLAPMQDAVCGPNEDGEHVVRVMPPTLAQAWPGLSAEAYVLSGASHRMSRMLGLGPEGVRLERGGFDAEFSEDTRSEVLGSEAREDEEVRKWKEAGRMIRGLWVAEAELASFEAPKEEKSHHKRTRTTEERMDPVTETTTLLYGDSRAVPAYARAKRYLGPRWKDLHRGGLPSFLQVPMPGALLRALPVTVCEECYLVFADLGTLRLGGIPVEYAVKANLTSGAAVTDTMGATARRSTARSTTHRSTLPSATLRPHSAKSSSSSFRFDGDIFPTPTSPRHDDHHTPRHPPPPPPQRPNSTREHKARKPSRPKSARPRPQHAPSHRPLSAGPRRTKQLSSTTHTKPSLLPPPPSSSSSSSSSASSSSSHHRSLRSPLSRPSSAATTSRRRPGSATPTPTQIAAPVFGSDPSRDFPVRLPSPSDPPPPPPPPTAVAHRAISFQAKDDGAEEERSPPKSPMRMPRIRPEPTIESPKYVQGKVEGVTAAEDVDRGRKEFILRIGRQVDEKAREKRHSEWETMQRQFKERQAEIRKESMRRKQTRGRRSRPISDDFYSHLTKPPSVRMLERMQRMQKRKREERKKARIQAAAEF